MDCGECVLGTAVFGLGAGAFAGAGALAGLAVGGPIGAGIGAIAGTAVYGGVVFSLALAEGLKEDSIGQFVVGIFGTAMAGIAASHGALLALGAAVTLAVSAVYFSIVAGIILGLAVIVLGIFCCVEACDKQGNERPRQQAQRQFEEMPQFDRVPQGNARAPLF